LRIRPLVASHLVLLLPSEHRLADVDELTLAQLAGETWIDSPQGCSNRAIVDAAFLAGGHSREVVLEVLDIAAMPRYVEAGLGVAFVPDFSGARDAPVRRRLLANQRLQWPIFLASARTAHPRPSLAAFLELATSAARDAAHRLGVSPSAADLA
jgi:DNA-binding transcriptional LysR family regulator